MRLKRFCIGLSAVLAVVVVAGIVVTAQHTKAAGAGEKGKVKEKPFKISGSGTVDFIPLTVGPTANHTAEGNATHLGKYHLRQAAVQLDSAPVDDPETGGLIADFSSAVDPVFVAANGDELTLHYDGTVQAIPVVDDDGNPTGEFRTHWVADFTPVPAGNTGRFTKVVGGSFVMIANGEPFVPGDTDVVYSWSGDGFLEWEN